MSKLELWKSSHSINKIGLHIVWCTKFRHPVITDKVEIVIKNVIGEACATYNWGLRALEIMPDHVHLFIQINHTDTPVKIAQTLKSLTAVAVFYAFPKIKSKWFWGSGLWNQGTFYSSVGEVSQESINKYIESQKTK